MTTHPPVTDWADFVRDALDSEKAAVLRRHLRTCASCRRTADAFAAIATLGRAEVTRQPSFDALARAESLFKPNRVAEPWLTRIGALMLDSWAQPALAGTRSGPSAGDRYLKYRTGPWRLAVRLDTGSSGTLLVAGQVDRTGKGTSAWAGMPAALLSGRRTLAETSLNAAGEFQFEALPARQHLRLQLQILSAKVRLEVPLPAPSARRTIVPVRGSAHS